MADIDRHTYSPINMLPDELYTARSSPHNTARSSPPYTDRSTSFIKETTKISSTQTSPSKKFRGPAASKQLMRERQLELTTYDAFFFAACEVADDSIVHDRWVWFQLFFSLVIHTATVFIQIMLTVLLFATVVEQAENPYEDTGSLDNETAKVQRAIMQQEVIDRGNPSIRLCRADHTVQGVHTIVILIWLSRMIREIVNAVETTMIYARMPSPLSEGDIIAEKIEYDSLGVIINERYHILNLPASLRVFFVLFLGVVRVSIAVLLTWTSAKYLIFSGNVASVILKAVSMQFILKLDEIIFTALMPTSYGRKLRAAKIVYAGEPQSLQQQWGLSTCYVAIICFLLIFMKGVMFRHLDEFRAACREYYTAFPHERTMLMNAMDAVFQALK